MNYALTQEQREAVQTQDRAVFLLAAAGSGKTSVLVERYLSLLSKGRPENILAVTFTNEAADQLRNKILAGLREKESSSEVCDAVETTSRIGTIHSFCYSLLDQYGSALGLSPIQEILTPFELLPIFESEYYEWRANLSKSSLRFLIEHFGYTEMKTLAQDCFLRRRIFEKSLTKIEAPEGGLEIASQLFEIVKPLLGQLELKLAASGKYSFDDLEYFALAILQNNPEIAGRLQKQIRFILVDEFQDTSQNQWNIFSLLVGREYEKLFVVGDPKQSIYRFRNADARVFRAVSLQLEGVGGVQLELNTNFRANPLLVSEINKLSEGLFLNSTVSFSSMVAGRDRKESPVKPVRIYRYPQIEGSELFKSELLRVTEELKTLLERGDSPSSIALLFRVSDRIPDFFRALENKGIPSRGKRNVKLFEVYDILDFVNYLRVVFGPLNNFYLAAFLRSPYVDWSYQMLANLMEKEGKTLFEKLMNNPPSNLAWFFLLIERGTLTIDSVLEALFANTRYFPVNREAFLQILKPLKGSEMTLGDALNKLAVWEIQGLSFTSELETTEKNGVTLMTVHSAKGLEFDHVFLVDNLRMSPKRAPVLRLEEGHPPGIRCRREGEVFTSKTYTFLAESQGKEEAEETRRILYVALTRAKESVSIFLPENEKLIPKGSFGELLRGA